MDSIYSLNIERAVLSSIFFDQEIFEDILGLLKAEDFYHPAHRKIYAAMTILHSESLPIDEEFVRRKIKDKDVTDDIMIEILSTNPIANTLAYCAEIKDESIKRDLISLANEIKKVTIEEEQSSAAALDHIQNRLYKISTDTANNDLKDMKRIADDTLAHIHKMKAMGNQHLIGETTGYFELDKKTTGFNGGDLVIIAARPAMGKTSFVLNMALKNIEQNSGVIIFSLEMPSEQLMLRLLSAKTSIPLQNLRKGDMDDNQWTNLTRAFNELSSKKLFVHDGGSININQLRAKVRKLAGNKDNNIRMVIIDYLQLMTGVGTKDRHLEVSEISRGLKMLARELNIPVVALSQLNRGLEARPDKRPMLSDLRESGSIEQDADIIMFVYRDDVYKERDEARKEKEAKDKGVEYKSTFAYKAEEDAEIIIGKQRNGPVGTVKLVFQKALTRFIDKEHNSSEPTKFVFANTETAKETKIEMDMPDIGI